MHAITKLYSFMKTLHILPFALVGCMDSFFNLETFHLNIAHFLSWDIWESEREFVILFHSYIVICHSVDELVI